MQEVRVFIPEEIHTILKFRQEEMPGVAVINTGLRNFGQKTVFPWHLSLMIDFEDVIENGMPSQKERDIVDPFGDYLNDLFKGANVEKPNALFLGRITWNATKELIWRVYDPQLVEKELKRIIKGNSSPGHLITGWIMI
ncbi:MAG: DUF695 domain-containing protein [Bacteroidota bacterium]